MQFFPTTDEDFQYFRAQGYTGSINDMHFTAMGDLGYTGALTDRIHAYLVATFGSYHEAMRDLRNGTSVFSLISAYAINSLEPDLVLDFASEYYRTGGTATTLDSALTYTGASNGTMVDADGLLKWAPHNLVKYSSVTDNWGKLNCTITPSSGLDSYGNTTLGLVTGTGGAGDQCRINQGTSEALGVSHTVEFEFRPVDCDFVVVFHSDGVSGLLVYFDTGNGSVTSATVGANGVLWTLISSELVLLSAGLWGCKFEYSQTIDTTPINYVYLSDRANKTPVGGPYSGYIGNYRAYRSDLGGMVNNPDTGNSYVPTTTAARYLPRRGHHVYNGTSWVNEGLLHESEARTNLLTYSNDFTQWTKTAPMSVTQDQVGPDGVTNSATTITFPNSTDWIWQGFSGLSSTTYTVSLWLSGSGTIKLGAYSTALGFGSVDVVTLTSDITRYNYTFTTGAGDGDFRFNLGRIGGSTTATSVVCYGAQLEAASTPSSYIPTAGASATRAAETLTVPAANMPWPTPVVIGPELVTNGTFDTDVSGWTHVGTGSSAFVSGEIEVTTAGAAGAYQTFTTETGKVYRLTWDYTADTATSVSVRVGDGADLAGGIAIADTGDASVIFVALSTSTTVYIRNGGAGISYWDNISVKEINPLAVSIQMDGLMTYADNDIAPSGSGGFGEVVFNLWKLDNSNYIETVLNTVGGTGGVVFKQETLGTVDRVDTALTVYAPSINVPFNLSSRHGSAFINGAVDGTALTADTTPTALPDLSATDFQIGSTFMGNIGKLRVWADDLGDTGIAEAST